MGLFDTLSAQTPQGEQLRSGLLGMAAGLLQGSTGHYGQFGPALGQGFAGFAGGMQNAQQMQQQEMLRTIQAQKLQQQLRQQQQYQDFFAPQQTQGAQASPAGSTAENMQTRIQQAINSGNPDLVEWGFKQMQFQNQARQADMRGQSMALDEWSAPIQTSQGFGQVNRLTGAFRPITQGGQVLMPTTIDPMAQGNVSYAKTAGSEQAKADVAKPGETNAALTSLQSTESQLDRMEQAARGLLQHPGLDRITGYVGMFPNMPGGDAADAQATLENLKSQVGFSVLQAMREASKTGGALGAVSDKENEMLQNNLAALQNSQSPEQFRENLQRIIEFVEGSKSRMRDAYGRQYGAVPGLGEQPSPAQPTTPSGNFSSLWGG